MSQGDGTDPVVGMTGARFGGSRRKRQAAAEVAASTSVEAAADAITEPLPVIPAVGSFDAQAVPLDSSIGRTGARFGGRARRERQALETADTVDSGQRRSGPAELGDGDVAGADVGDREFSDAELRDGEFGAGEFGAGEVGAAEFDVAEFDADPIEDTRAADEQFETADSEEIAHIAVRPYVLTGGRTRPAVELAIEALVSVPADGEHQVDRRPDHAAVLELCGVPRSVAEIAALMHVALGVARVLVGDLAESGAVIVHRTSGAGGPDLSLMERVLGGLRKL